MTTATQKPCVGCGGPKPPGMGRRWCDACKASPSKASALARVLSRTTLTDSGCLILSGGAKNKYGYMQVSVANRKHAAHRFVYEQIRGPIPDGLELDHMCHNPRCVNVEHLEPVPPRVNKSRERKPFCRNGHLLSVHGWPNGRACRTCALAAMAQPTSCPSCDATVSKGYLRRHRLAMHAELEVGETA